MEERVPDIFWVVSVWTVFWVTMGRAGRPGQRKKPLNSEGAERDSTSSARTTAFAAAAE